MPFNRIDRIPVTGDATVPVVNPAAPTAKGCLSAAGLSCVLLLGLFLGHTLTHFPAPLHWPWPDRTPAPADPLAACVAAGQAYRLKLPAAHAGGLLKAADAIDAGKAVADAMAAAAVEFEAERQAAFLLAVKPALNAILPEGTEPADPAQRKAFGQALRAVAKGEMK